MSKSFFSKFLVALVFVAAAVLYLLQVLEVITFFNLSWAVMMISGSLGALFILGGLFGKNLGIIKKTRIILGSALLIVCLFSMVTAILIPEKIVFPIILIIVTGAILFSVVAVGGKKWDQGDNQNVGYKNYHQRKAEQEKEQAKQEKKDNKKK